MDLTFVVQSLLNGLLIGGVYGLVAIGLTVIFGVMKVINFAHGALMMLGMYASYWIATLLQINVYATIVFVLPLLFIVGVLFQKVLISPIMNAPAHNQLFLTLGVMLFLQNMAVYLWTPDYRILRTPYTNINFYIGDINISLVHILAFIMALVFSGILYVILHKTDLGRAIRASSEEPVGAKLMGINIKRIYWITFGIGAACAGVAGTAITPFFPIYPYVGDIFILTAYVVVVLGGMGSVLGALVGGLIIGMADSIGAMILPGSMKSVLSFVIFIMILLFKPTGLFGRQNA
ncbi:MAG: branched-chain amino acid ABC transporter permease [Desulfobacterales bacterium]|jgi:branched-chain amino acid transport system permease protein|nr:branched-chain amino acid ABC transporter permease [Desulfobacterales bacterium]